MKFDMELGLLLESSTESGLVGRKKRRRAAPKRQRCPH